MPDGLWHNVRRFLRDSGKTSTTLISNLILRLDFLPSSSLAAAIAGPGVCLHMISGRFQKQSIVLDSSKQLFVRVESLFGFPSRIEFKVCFILHLITVIFGFVANCKILIFPNYLASVLSGAILQMLFSRVLSHFWLG